MKKPFTLVYKDPALLKLVKKTPKKTLATWAKDCTKRVLPYFKKQHPADNKPQQALKTLQHWIKTGKFNMKTIRNAALASHASARETNEDCPARSVARAAGQATATAHAKLHALAAANYCLQATYRATGSLEKVKKEREWQRRHLQKLRNAPKQDAKQ